MTLPTSSHATTLQPSAQELADALLGFHDPTRRWFEAAFREPTPAQALGWRQIQAGRSTLILAPTGSGKTLAAFLAGIDRLMFDPEPHRDRRCRIVYISPLKALAVDVERNLRAPLEGVARMAESLGHEFRLPTVAVRTGDTPAGERARFGRKSADILITTPESLYLLLTSQARERLSGVEWVIVDETHTMVDSKRGAHLALTLERLEEIAGEGVGRTLQRIGLSATVRPIEEAARYLGGFHACASGEEPEPRPVEVVDVGSRRELDLRVEVPVEDMTALPEHPGSTGYGMYQGTRKRSIWPSAHPMLLELIQSHRSTILFVNSRRLAERLAAALNELAGKELVQAHHGSIARDQRLAMEESLKSGKLPAMVATSSLELGIDMGAVDLVIQVEAPPSVASGLQRIGRAGHQVGAPSKGRIIPKYRGDLLACAALVPEMRGGRVEERFYPRQPLDVLAQQLVAMVAVEDWSVDRLEQVVRRAAPFSGLTPGPLHSVLDLLSGRYPSEEFAEFRARITWDRGAGMLSTRDGARRVAVENSGVIPDRGLYPVYLIDEASPGRGSRRVGELDEEMVFETHEGSTFVLGASTWKIEQITPDRVLVSPAPGEPGPLPFWKGDGPGRPLEFGRAIGALSRRLRELPEEAATQLLTQEHALSETAARNLLAYLEDQHRAIGAVPDDRTLVVESYLDEMGDWRVCLLSPFGSQVNAPWATAIAALAAERKGLNVDVMWSDDGIVARFPEAESPPDLSLLLPDPDEVEEIVTRRLGATALFSGRFREAAGRALLLPRKRAGQRTPLWHLRRRATDLLQAASKYPGFPIVLEAYRECLRDVFDMPALVGLLRQIQSREVRTVSVTSRSPSPFASALLFGYVKNFIYEQDTPLAERRAQALTIDPAQLRELLGDVELRELLDLDALELLERQLQCLEPGYQARRPDGLHDLCLRLGDLTTQELCDRCEAPPERAREWIRDLELDGRIILLRVGGEERWVAVEDAARYRDVLGCELPDDLPAELLESRAGGLSELIARYARTRGPFPAPRPALRFGLGGALIANALGELEAAGRVSHGEFHPAGSGTEWCDTRVLRTLRSRSLAVLRREVEPVEPEVYGRFLAGWQGLGAADNSLAEAIRQLQGASTPASDLERRILPARLPDYQPRDLDLLTTSGLVIWVGVEPLGETDGRVALYTAEEAPLLLRRPGADSVSDRPEDPLCRALRTTLATRGALFFTQLLQAAPGEAPKDVCRALWRMVWAGEVTNDSLEPLRAYLNPRRKVRAGYRPVLTTRALIPPEAAGRWSLVETLVGPSASDTARLAAHAEALVGRHGVLTRDAVAAEGFPGGFPELYPMLRELEENGMLRRGYFVAGQGAAQFAHPGAVERLRSERLPNERPVDLLLAACDPANPYGTALPWPEREGRGRPMRAAGAVVALLDGRLAAWRGRLDRGITTFPPPDGEAIAGPWGSRLVALFAAEIQPGSSRSLFIREIDGISARESDLARHLEAAGFRYGPQGYVLRG